MQPQITSCCSSPSVMPSYRRAHSAKPAQLQPRPLQKAGGSTTGAADTVPAGSLPWASHSRAVGMSTG
ncbi:hypothetical protein Save01_04485 [Streptomyces avermitilis]